MRDQHSVPVTAMIYLPATPVYDSPDSKAPASEFTRSLSVAYVFAVTNGRVAVGDAENWSNCVAKGFVTATNILFRRGNIALESACVSNVPDVAVGDKGPFLVVGQGSDKLLVTSPTTAGYGFEDEPPLFRVSDEDASCFVRGVSSLHLWIAGQSAGGNISDNAQQGLVAAYGDQSVRWMGQSASGRLDLIDCEAESPSWDVILDCVLSPTHNGLGGRAIMLSFWPSGADHLNQRLYIAAALQGSGVRVYALDTPELKKDAAWLVSQTSGKFLPIENGKSMQSHVTHAVRQVMGLEWQESVQLVSAAEQFISSASEDSAFIENLLARGYRLRPVPDSRQKPISVASTVCPLGVYDRAGRLREALVAFRDDTRYARTTENPIEIVGIYASLADVFDLRLESAVATLIANSEMQSFVAARDLLVNALQSLPWLPRWAHDVIENDWRADFKGIEDNELTPLIEQLSGIKEDETVFLPLMQAK